jgi:hypothetical protein
MLFATMNRRALGVLAAVCLVGLTAGVAGVLIKTQKSPAAPKEPTATWRDGRPIPPEGLVVTEGRRGGDPNNAVEDLKAMYVALDRYRAKHKKFPPIGQFLDTSKPLVDDVRLSPEHFQNPDHSLSDRTYLEGDLPYSFGFLGKRPDETPVPVFPQPGERDVWVKCDIYARHRQVVFPDGGAEHTIHGVYVVLWSDGSVEQIPAKDLLLAPVSGVDGRFRNCLPGQAGVPADAFPYSEKFRTQGNIKYEYRD